MYQGYDNTKLALLINSLKMMLIIFLCFENVNAQNFKYQLLNKGSLFTKVSVLQDFDKDGDLDIIITRQNPTTALEWLENKGTGQFPRHEFYHDDSMVRPFDLDTCDCDNDGDLDYVISDTGNVTKEGQLFLLERQDDNTFIKWTIEAGLDFTQADIADFNNDGRSDIVTVGFDQKTVNIYLNDGDMKFTKKTIASDKVQAKIVEADDIDGDGDIDVVFGGSDAMILWNNGDATFSDGPNLYTWYDLAPSAASGLAVTDLNGDGSKDILTFSNTGTGGLYFLDGSKNFDQTLIERIQIDLGGDILVADIDGNGLKDVIRQQYSNGILSILYQNKPMQFQSVILDYNWDNKGPSQMQLGDLDGDGDLDLVFPENGNVDGDISWYENIGGELYRHQIYETLMGAYTPKIADIDNDGNLDVIVTVTENIAKENEIIWFENRTDSGFVDWRIVDTLNYPVDVEVADIDGDKKLDLVASSRDDNDLLWFKKAGYKWEAHKIENNANKPLSLSVSDLDSDGYNDIALISSADNKIFWYKNDGSGNFDRRVVDANLSKPKDIESTDLDKDGDVDLVAITDDSDNPLALYVNDGNGNFSKKIFQLNDVASDIVIGDWTGDMRPDILVSFNENITAEPDVEILKNDGNSNFIVDTLVSDQNHIKSIHLTDLDNDGDPDLIVGHDEYFSNRASPIQILINQDGIIGSSISLLDKVSGNIVGIDSGDLNNDSYVDFVVTDFKSNNLLMFLNKGTEPTEIESEVSHIPLKFALKQNYPNPFNPSTTIAFNLPERSHVLLRIYDILGREVVTLISGNYPAGKYMAHWNADKYASGAYIYQIVTDKFKDSKMMLLLK